MPAPALLPPQHSAVGRGFSFPRQFWTCGHLHPGLSSLHSTSGPCTATRRNAERFPPLWCSGWGNGNLLGTCWPYWSWEGASRGVVPWVLLPGSAPGKVIATKPVNTRPLSLHPGLEERGGSLPAVGLGRRSSVGVTSGGTLDTHGMATAGAGLGALPYRGGIQGLCGGAGDRGRRSLGQCPAVGRGLSLLFPAPLGSGSPHPQPGHASTSVPASGSGSVSTRAHREPHPASSPSSTLSRPTPSLPSCASTPNPPGAQASSPEVVPAPRTSPLKPQDGGTVLGGLDSWVPRCPPCYKHAWPWGCGCPRRVLGNWGGLGWGSVCARPAPRAAQRPQP